MIILTKKGESRLINVITKHIEQGKLIKTQETAENISQSIVIVDYEKLNHFLP